MTRVSYGHIPDELILLIFRLRDKNDCSFNHGLVCKQWHRLACLTQTAVSIHSGRRITTAELFRSISKFTDLTSLTLFGPRITDFDDFLLAGLGSVCPKLTHLLIDNQEKHSVVTTAGLNALSASCTGLQSLSINILGDKIITVPSSFSILSSLTEIDLSIRAWKFPEYTLHHMSLLKNVKFRNLQFYKFPEAFGWPPTLTELRIFDCKNLLRMPEFDEPRSLTRLTICGSDMMTALPESISQCESLKECYLHHNPSLKFLSDSFFSVSSLEVLELVDCKNLRNFPTHVSDLVRLERILLQKCPKITSLPRSFGQLPSLRYLAIKECENIGRLPQSIGHLSSLERLDLCQLEAFSVIPSTIHMLSSLRAIVLQDCRNIFTRPDFTLHLHRCTGLQSLEFHWPANCTCDKDRPGVTTLDEGLVYSICRVSSLSSLVLYGLPTLSTIPQQLENLSQLERLELHSWPNLERLPASITKLSKLRTLVISGCPKFKNGAAVIRALPNVSVNVLEGNS